MERIQPSERIRTELNEMINGARKEDFIMSEFFNKVSPLTLIRLKFSHYFEYHIILDREVFFLCPYLIPNQIISVDAILTCSADTTLHSSRVPAMRAPLARRFALLSNPPEP